MLHRMCRYVADCIGKYGEIIVFGDDDEGKILDLQGGKLDHYRYVLQLLGILLREKYIDGGIAENNRWIFDEDEINVYENRQLYTPEQYNIYKEGGNSILRSMDNEVLIGVDHAALGFGSIAAHGHADAMSFQLFYQGRPVFVDPGTYIYHCDLQSRNEFRMTRNHNTVCVDDKNQSEMLGAFLWGKKANTKLISAKQENNSLELVMEHDGYNPIKVSRIIMFDGNRHLQIKDKVSSSINTAANFILSPDIVVSIKDTRVLLYRGSICIAVIRCNRFQIIEREYSNRYGIKQTTSCITVPFDKECTFDIQIL